MSVQTLIIHVVTDGDHLKININKTKELVLDKKASNMDIDLNCSDQYPIHNINIHPL